MPIILLKALIRDSVSNFTLQFLKHSGALLSFSLKSRTSRKFRSKTRNKPESKLTNRMFRIKSSSSRLQETQLKAKSFFFPFSSSESKKKLNKKHYGHINSNKNYDYNCNFLRYFFFLFCSAAFSQRL